MPLVGGVATPFLRGWLTFESDGKRRRLVPIPDGWEDADPPELRKLCESAQPVGQTPTSGWWRIEKRD